MNGSVDPDINEKCSKCNEIEHQQDDNKPNQT